MLDAPTISKVLGSHGANVAANWPLIVGALSTVDILSLTTEIAAAATVMVETGTFAPILEKMAGPHQPELYKRQMEYFPYIGRGFVQLTWKKNYAMFGPFVGVDLVRYPYKALEASTAAMILAEYFRQMRVADAAKEYDWKRVRRLVNGGYHQLDLFIEYAHALGGRP